MQQTILSLNAGSSSLKFALFRAGNLEQMTRGEIEGIGEAAQKKLFEWLERNNHTVCAIGYRVVHGGEEFVLPTVLNERIITQLEQYNSLAPLHQPHSITIMRALAKNQPDLFQVACFDTAFHAQMPWVEQTFALPPINSPAVIKRYGFHGLSYEYITHVLPDYLGDTLANKKIIIAHLGNGASLCAIRNGKSVATTMGLSALDGLMMGTRCGNMDPGVILYLLTVMELSAQEITDLLYHRSGLLGISGISNDMRILIQEFTEQKNNKAKQAIDLFLYFFQRELGALVAVLGGVDSIVFTAGIGENAVLIRERACLDAAWLGIKIDNQANQNNSAKISSEDSPVSVWVIPTNEELMVAQHTWDLFKAQ